MPTAFIILKVVFVHVEIIGKCKHIKVIAEYLFHGPRKILLRLQRWSCFLLSLKSVVIRAFTLFVRLCGIVSYVIWSFFVQTVYQLFLHFAVSSI